MLRERERERDERGLLKEFKEFSFRAVITSEILSFFIFYLLLRERAIALLPPCKHLKQVLVKKSSKFSQIYPKIFIKFSTKKGFPRLIYERFFL
jgi:hypothetical protein